MFVSLTWKSTLPSQHSSTIRIQHAGKARQRLIPWPAIHLELRCFLA